MSQKNKAAQDYTGREFIITREFAAPRALVFQAWTDAKHLAQWWGPRGFTNPVCEWEAQPGKVIHVVMRAPNGVDHPMGGAFREVVAPERLVFTSGALDEKAHLVFEFLHTVLLAEEKGRTRLTITSRVLKTTAEANKYIGGFEAGMTQSLEKLGDYLARQLPGVGEGAAVGRVVVVREYDAPPGRVFDAWLDPDAAGRWLFATAGGQMQRVEIDAKVGGKFVIAEKRGETVVEHCGTYLEIARPRRLVFNFAVPQYAKEVTRVTIEIAARGSGCALTLTHEGVLSEYRERTRSGWTMLLQGLATTVGDERTIVISREFEAPRELVWQAMVDPKQVVKWWGPRGFSTTITEMDVRPGGVWSQVMHGADGANYPNKSVFKEVVKPERIVFSHGGGREGAPGVHFVATWTFDEVRPGRTKVTIRMVFESAADWDKVVKEYGAIEGGQQTLERLAEHLREQGRA